MKKETKTTTIHFIAQAAVIAAIYAVLTLAIKPLSYGAVQFRFAEALCILPVFTPAAIPGLTIGCFIANLLGSDFPLDMLFGTLATLLAAVCTRIFRNKKVKGLPLLSSFFPVIFNAVIVGLEITFSMWSTSSQGSLIKMFIATAFWVGVGELVCACVIGIILYKALDNTGVKKILRLEK